jgi:PhnB protein
MSNDLKTQASFAPILYLINVAASIEFYKQAFGAKELRRFSNDDGSVHVAEMEIADALFHIHEETAYARQLSPLTLNGTCLVIGLFVEDPDAMMERAVALGATVRNPMQDYDYGYRQGDIIDPFGHHWTIEKRI